MIHSLRPLAALLMLAVAASAQAQEAVRQFGPADTSASLILRTTTDIAAFAPTVEAFLETRPGLSLRYEQWGSNELFARSARDCAGGIQGADIVISSGVHQIVKLVNDNCGATWVSSQTRAQPASLRWRDQVWGISREPAVMVYNRDLVFASEVPRTRFDLLDLLRPDNSRFAGRVATYDIKRSGLGFLFAYMDSQEATTFGALMEAFARSGAVATCCSAEIIAGVARGDYLIAYNVLGSYAAESAAADPSLGIVAPEDYTLILSRAAFLPGAAPNPEAGAFLDFILSTEGELSMVGSQLVMSPANAIGIDENAGEMTHQRLIHLGPQLLVAMDHMKADRFLALWQQAFSGGER